MFSRFINNFNPKNFSQLSLKQKLFYGSGLTTAGVVTLSNLTSITFKTTYSEVEKAKERRDKIPDSADLDINDLFYINTLQIIFL